MRLNGLLWILPVCLALGACSKPVTRPWVSLDLQLEGATMGAHVDNFPLHGVVDVIVKTPTGSDAGLRTEGWELAIAADGTFYQTVDDVVFEKPLPAELEPGKTYQIPFHIGISSELASLIAARWSPQTVSVSTLKVFSPGQHEIKAVLQRRGGKPDHLEPIESDPTKVTIDSGYSRNLSNGDITQLLPAATGTIRSRILEKYPEAAR